MGNSTHHSPDQVDKVLLQSQSGFSTTFLFAFWIMLLFMLLFVVIVFVLISPRNVEIEFLATDFVDVGQD
jgi:hypothetical protein